MDMNKFFESSEKEQKKEFNKAVIESIDILNRFPVVDNELQQISKELIRELEFLKSLNLQGRLSHYSEDYFDEDSIRKIRDLESKEVDALLKILKKTSFNGYYSPIEYLDYIKLSLDDLFKSDNFVLNEITIKKKKLNWFIIFLIILIVVIVIVLIIFRLSK